MPKFTNEIYEFLAVLLRCLEVWLVTSGVALAGLILPGDIGVALFRRYPPRLVICELHDEIQVRK